MARRLPPFPILVAVVALLAAACSPAASMPPTPSPAPTVDVQAQIRATADGLDQALAKYRAGDAAAAEAMVGDVYLDHYELVEDPLAAKDKAFMEKLEDLIREEIRNAMRAGKPVDQVAALVASAKADLAKAAEMLR